MIRLPHSLLPGPGGGPAQRLAPLPEGAEPRRLRRPAATHLRLDAGHACTPPTGPPPDTPLMMAILRAGQGGSEISVKSSSGLSTVVIEERKKSPTATGRSPPALRTVSPAPSATITAGSSAAGSAC